MRSLIEQLFPYLASPERFLKSTIDSYIITRTLGGLPESWYEYEHDFVGFGRSCEATTALGKVDSLDEAMERSESTSQKTKNLKHRFCMMMI